ncbi:hypothetical protein D3C84_536990 [compost metagenome]
MLHQFLENHHLQLAQALEAEHLGAGLPGDLAGLVDVLEVGLADLRVELEDRVEHREACERLAEMEHLVAVRHVGAAQHQLRQLAEQFFGQVHVVFVVGVGLVELEHGELGVVPGRNAFVTEVAVDLEDLLEAADHQALEVQLRRDAQEHGHVQRVVVGLEGLGRGATGDGLQHRRFHFEEVALGEELADVADDPGAHAEGIADFLVDDQVDVALAVTLFGVGQAVVLVRQRTQRLGQQAHVGHLDVQVALAGTGQGALGGDDVAQVPVLDRFQGLGRQGLAVDVDLDAPGHVLDHHEGATVEHDATGDLDRDCRGFQLFLGLVDVLFLQVRAVILAAEVIREGIALLAHGSKLFLALGDQLVFFLLQFVKVEFLVAHGLSICLASISNWVTVGASLLVKLREHARSYQNAARQSPCLRLASRYSSRSPSSTLSQSLRSTPVRRSLIRDWSRT